MRVLLVIDSLEVGGAERHVADLAHGLRCAGHRVTVACAAGGPLQAELIDAGVPVAVLGPRRVKRRVSVAFGLALRRLLQRERYDLVHAHLYAGSFAARVAVLGTGLPLFVTVHSEGTWQDPVQRLVCTWVYRRARRVIAVSHALTRQLAAFHRVPRERILTAPNAIRAAPHPPRIQPPSDSGQMVVGVVARLTREKGVDLFLRAFAQVAAYCPEARAVIVGDGPERARLEGDTIGLDLAGRVEFLGRRLDARRLIAGFDLLVLPSRSEGAPLVVLEAMDAGVAVLATRVGGVPEQIDDGMHGLLVLPGDAGELARALERLIRDPRLRRRLAAAGQQRVRRERSHGEVVRCIEAAYAAALRGRPARIAVRRATLPE